MWVAPGADASRRSELRLQRSLAGVDNPVMGRSVSARRRVHPRVTRVASSVVLSALGAGIAVLIVALTSIAAWVGALIATAILLIGVLARERLKPRRS